MFVRLDGEWDVYWVMGTDSKYLRFNSATDIVDVGCSIGLEYRRCVMVI